MKNLKKNWKLRELDISKNDIGNSAIENLMDEIRDKTEIRFLRIADTSFTAEICTNLFGSIKHNRYLAEFDL